MTDIISSGAAADSLGKYAKQATQIISSAPVWQWPSIIAYMLEVLIYRASKIRVRNTLYLNLYGLSFTIKTHNIDLGIIYEVFSERIYAGNEEFVPKEGWTCLDIGANIGCVSMFWAQRNQRGKIYAVEPHPDTFKRLSKNVAENGFRNIVCLELAVDRQSGELSVVVSDATSMAVAVAAAPVTPDMKQTCLIKAISLDELYQAQDIVTADLLKIDVEGHEIACLEGAKEALSKTRRLILEYHSEALGDRCREILVRAGFSLYERGPLIFATNKLSV